MSIFKKKSVTSIVNGQEKEFYPMSVSLFWRRKDLLQKLRTAAASLFSGSQGSLSGHNIEKQTMPDGTVVESTTILPLSEDIVKARAEAREKVWKDALDIILADDSKNALAELFMDSLRTEYARHLIVLVPEQEKFMENLDLEDMVELVRGFVAANAKVFGPLGQQIAEAMRAKLKDVLADNELLSSEQSTPSDSSSERDSEPAVL